MELVFEDFNQKTIYIVFTLKQKNFQWLNRWLTLFHRVQSSSNRNILMRFPNLAPSLSTLMGCAMRKLFMWEKNTDHFQVIAKLMQKVNKTTKLWTFARCTYENRILFCDLEEVQSKSVSMCRNLMNRYLALAWNSSNSNGSRKCILSLAINFKNDFNKNSIRIVMVFRGVRFYLVSIYIEGGYDFKHFKLNEVYR